MTTNNSPGKKVTIREFVRRIGPKQAVLFIVLPIILLFIVIPVFISMYSLMTDNIDYKSLAYKTECVDEFEQFLEPGVNTINHTAYGVEDQLESGASHERILQFIIQQDDHIDEEFAEYTTGIYGLIEGDLLDSSDYVPEPGYDPASRPWYTEAVEHGNDLTFVTPYIDTMTGETTMTIAKCLSDGVSVVAMDIQIDEMLAISDKLRDESDEWHDFIILDEDGTVILHSDTSQIGLNYLDTEDEPGRTIGKKVLTEQDEDIFDAGPDNTEYLYFPAKMTGGWHLVIVYRTNEYLKDIYRMITLTFSVTVAGIVLIIILVFLFTSRKFITEEYDSDLKAISGIYDSMHKINLEENKLEVIKALPGKTAQQLETDSADGSESFRRLVEFIVNDKFRDEMLEFSDLTTLRTRLADSDTITDEFKDRIGKWCRARFIVDEREEDGEIRSVLWAVENIDKERRARERLKRLSETDGMTGILNRASGENKIRKSLQTDDGGMFIMLDIDRFKSINDTYGHNVGDQVIIAVAECMQSTFRDHDIILRLGGDEFAAFMPGVCDRESGGIIISRFLESIEKISITGHEELNVEVSIGVSFCDPSQYRSFDELYKTADNNTYESKSHTGSYVTY